MVAQEFTIVIFFCTAYIYSNLSSPYQKYDPGYSLAISIKPIFKIIISATIKNVLVAALMESPSPDYTGSGQGARVLVACETHA